MDFAFAVVELFGCVIGLTRNAVMPTINVDFNIAGVVTGLQKFLHANLVAFFGRANEIADVNIEAIPCVGKQRRDLVDELFWRNTFGIGELLNFQAVLIGAS